MRKFLTSVFILTASSAFATILSPENALRRVTADSDGPQRIPGNGEISLVETLNSPSGIPAVYFFKDTADGWMVVSASDATDALLGYGDSYTEGVDMPPQMKWWLSQYTRQIAISDSLATLYPQIMNSIGGTSQDPSKARPKPIHPLMKTKWNQSAPYDLFTPTVDGRKTPTGCVATALAQVMKYHNYPPAGNGSGSATAGGEEFYMNLDIPISWTDMLDEYTTGNYTDTQAEAVANLMLMAAYGCKMQYAPGGSGAYNVDANRTLVENFSYAPSAWAYYRDHYDTDLWKSMLYEELANNRPIYYSGYASGGGHAFVCDGISVLGYFHFNWGWGGSYDGYFKMDALNPGGQGIGGFSGGYNTDQVAFLGVTPPTGDEKMPVVRLSSSDTTKCRISDTNVITLTGEWYNMSYVETDFTVALELIDTAKGDKWQIASFQETVPPYYGYDQLDFDTSSFDGPDGEYAARVVTCSGTDTEWLPVLKPYWEPEYVFLTKSDNSWQINPEGNFNEISTILQDNNVFDVYTPSGILVRKAAADCDINSLDTDIYILRNGDKTIKTKINH